LLADMILVSNAIWTTVLAKAFDTSVRFFGSTLSMLSHHRNGLSTQPPIEGAEVALVVAELPAEEVDLLLRLAAALPGEQAACRKADAVEVNRIGTVRRQQLVVVPGLVEEAIDWSRETCDALQRLGNVWAQFG
jgi:hypothetical protein